MAADTPILDVANLSASYGPVRILHDISFSLAEGESIAVLGANGAGKSTLLRAISGLMVRRDGHIRFDGQDIANRRPDQIVHLGISQVPEGRRLFFPLTVTENLEAGALPLRQRNRALRGGCARPRGLRRWRPGGMSLSRRGYSECLIW